MDNHSHKGLFKNAKKTFKKKLPQPGEVRIRYIMVNNDERVPGEFHYTNCELLVTDNRELIQQLATNTRPVYIIYKKQLYYKLPNHKPQIINLSTKEFNQLIDLLEIRSRDIGNKKRLSILKLEYIEKITKYYFPENHQQESEEKLIQRMTDQLNIFINSTYLTHLRKNCEGFSHIVMIKHQPELEDIHPNILIGVLKNQQLTIYWVDSGKLNSKSISEDTVQSIINRLPEINTESSDQELIHDIILQYKCEPFKADWKNTKPGIRIKPGYENEITCLSFAEFFFYPSEEQGPLSKQAFTNLLINIEKIASDLPENLHILFASVPVIDENQQVHNMICYVECGKEPKLHPFTKALPSKIDMLYPGTSNVYKTTGSSAGYLIKSIEDFIDYTEYDNEYAITRFIKNILQNPDYPPPEELLKIFEDYLNKLKNIIVTTNEELKNDWDKLLGKLRSYSEITVQDNNISELNAISDVKNIPGITMSNTTTTAGYHYGGNIKSKTLGGIEFIININICLDSTYSLAQKAFKKDLALKNEYLGGEFVPNIISTIITSASIGVDSEEILGPNFAQIDSKRKRTGIRESDESNYEEPYHEYTLDNLPFGNPVKIIINKPVSLGEVLGKEDRLIKEYNKLNLQIKSLKHLAVQQPDLINHFTRKMANILAKEAANKSIYWKNADPLEQKKITLWIENELLNIDKLIEQNHLGKLIKEKTSRIDSYFIEKKNLIGDLHIYLQEHNTTLESDFLKHKLPLDDEIKNKAVNSLLAYLFNDKKVTFKAFTLNLILEENSELGKIIKEYYDKNITILLPKSINDYYDKHDKNTRLKNKIL